MKLRGREKNKFINIVLISILTFILFSCFLTLILDIGKNKSILPLIFFILMIYSILMFLYFLFYGIKYEEGKFNFSNFKVSYLLFFIINLIMFSISYIALWI